MSVDHLHVDAMFMGLAFVEIHMMYAALAGGGAPIALPEAGSYEDYCVRQREFTDSLTPPNHRRCVGGSTSPTATRARCRSSRCRWGGIRRCRARATC